MKFDPPSLITTHILAHQRYFQRLQQAFDGGDIEFADALTGAVGKHARSAPYPGNQIPLAHSKVA